MNRLPLGTVCLFPLLAASVALAQEALPAKAFPATDRVVLLSGQSSTLEFLDPVERVAVNNPSIADIVVISPTEILVQGKQAGSTSMVVWQSGRKKSYTVTVRNAGHRRGAFDEFLRRVMPEEDELFAYEAEKAILLAGRAKHPANMNKAVQAAQAVAEKVVNMADLTDFKQVLIEVRLAEVDRTFAKALGIDYFSQSRRISQGGFVSGGLSPQTPATPKFTRVVDPKDILLSPALKQLLEIRGGGYDWAFAIQALEEQGLVRILAEPNLLALSGEKASFLAGGEFPVPIVQASAGGNSVSVTFKEFGVRLNFKPEVTAEDSIRLFVEPEVSVLEFGQAAVKVGGFSIPSLLTRRASTTVQMNSGESLLIGGLLSEDRSSTKDQVPFLGEVPILGQLFKSEKFKNRETELLVLVTPRLIQPQTLDLPDESKKEPREMIEAWKKGGR